MTKQKTTIKHYTKVYEIKAVARFKKKASASFTIEAAIVVPICMVVLVSVILTAFYLHDSVVLKAAAPSLVLESAVDLQKEESIEYDYETYFKRRLIVLKNAAIESGEKEDGVVFNSSGDFYVDLGMAGRLLEKSLGSQNVQIGIIRLKARKNLIKYKMLCEEAEKVGLVEGAEK